MGFCYPGTGKSGDLPPRPECAEHWRKQLLGLLPDIQLTLVIGQYAQAWHLGERQKDSLTETVKNWKEYWPRFLRFPIPARATICGSGEIRGLRKRFCRFSRTG